MINIRKQLSENRPWDGFLEDAYFTLYVYHKQLLFIELLTHFGVCP
jgi:hypothetical protein